MVAKNFLESSMAPPADAGIMELNLLVSRRQFDALEQRARDVGLSVAQLLRRLVQDSIAQETVATYQE